MKSGQRVIATRRFGGVFGMKVPKGRKGIVVEVEPFLFFGAMYRVKFDKISGWVSCSSADIKAI